MTLGETVRKNIEACDIRCRRRVVSVVNGKNKIMYGCSKT